MGYYQQLRAHLWRLALPVALLGLLAAPFYASGVTSTAPLKKHAEKGSVGVAQSDGAVVVATDVSPVAAVSTGNGVIAGGQESTTTATANLTSGTAGTQPAATPTSASPDPSGGSPASSSSPVAAPLPTDPPLTMPQPIPKPYPPYQPPFYPPVNGCVPPGPPGIMHPDYCIVMNDQ
ncbi:MAG TPA: hypothetical protein VLF91_06290 [Candidatus Saccharimonadales bacterium]|nr:hypothetical protein [Candidatus Saccharimonadales bacterium]